MTKSKSLTKPIKTNAPVSRLVIDRIKEALINKELKPGDYLPSETELSKNLGVGKSSVREAVKMLEAIGVVDVKQGSGTVICDRADSNSVNSLMFQLILENSNFEYLLGLRAMFEPAYTIMAMNSATDEDKKKIKITIEKYEKNIQEGRPYFDDDLEFHYEILNSTHNPLVIKIGETVLQLFSSLISESIKVNPQIALEDHKKIFAGICEKDETKIREAIARSLKVWSESII